MSNTRTRDVTMADHWYNFGIEKCKTDAKEGFIGFDEYMKWCEEMSELFFGWLKRAKNLAFSKLPMKFSINRVSLYSNNLIMICNRFGGRTEFKPMLLRSYFDRLIEIPKEDRHYFPYFSPDNIQTAREYERADNYSNLSLEFRALLWAIDKAFGKRKNFAAAMSCRIMTNLRRILLDSIEMDIVRKLHCFCFYWTNENIQTHRAKWFAHFYLLNAEKEKAQREL